MSMQITKQERTPEMIAMEIVVIKNQTAQTIARAAFEIGQRLCEAKALVPAGEWMRYLEEKLDYKIGTAENLMRIYREFGDDQIDLTIGKSPAELFGQLNQSQMVAMFSLSPAERVELMEENPDLAEKSSREVKRLVEEKKAAEQERDRERAQREKAESIASQQADRAERMNRQTIQKNNEIAESKRKIDALEKQLRDAKKSEERAALASDLEKELESEREARNQLEEELKTLREKPVEVAVEQPSEEMREQIRQEIAQEYQIRLDEAEQKIENLKNADAQAISMAFKLIQAQFTEMRGHFEKFRETNADKAALLASASAQTFRNMAEILDKFR